MPKITINEAERQTFASINAIENVVLVPLFLRSEFEGIYKTEKFTSRDTFVNRFTGKCFDDETSEYANTSFIAGPVIDVFDDNEYETTYALKKLAEIKQAIGTGISRNINGVSVSHKDKSYLMICELLSNGLSVVVKPLFHDGFFKDDHELTVELNRLIATEGAFSEFKDKNLYNIKFITTGAYPNIYDIGKRCKYSHFDDPDDHHWYLDTDLTDAASVEYEGCYKVITELAETRGDSIALVELEKNIPISVETNYLVTPSSSQDGGDSDLTYGQEYYTVRSSESSEDSGDDDTPSDHKEWDPDTMPDGYLTIEGETAPNNILYKDFQCDLIGFVAQSFTDTSAMNNYSAAFYPWGLYDTTAAGISIMRQTEMPAGYGYLMAYASSVKQNPDWLAASGVIRGRVSGLISTLYQVGEAAMHFLQNEDNDVYNTTSGTRICINPIMQVGTYGTRIWGNRVCAPSTDENTYFKYLNVRMLLCDIKKQLYHSSLRVTFEPNDNIAWLNFKELNNRVLDQMQSSRGIEWYRWAKLVADKKATLKAVLTIKPIEALEYFDITVNLTDSGEVQVEEVVV